MFGDIFRGKKILVTGHTGFKGAWLTFWLESLGAHVSGISLDPTEPSLYQALNLKERLGGRSHIQDLREPDGVLEILDQTQPDLVFHLAAQAIVRTSYDDPVTNWSTNVMGLVHLFECMRKTQSVRGCVVVTSDKCYENREWCWGYRETDPMGGFDPYSASKGAAELVTSSYRRSYFDSTNIGIASARAGNVIGGGDWSKDRLVTDFVASIVSDIPLKIRNPLATRPWQHVLEPLSGYLQLGQKLLEGSNPTLFADGWNFGPSSSGVATVETLADLLVKHWGSGTVEVERNAGNPHEAGYLKLDCSKADTHLAWHSIWSIEETIRRTVEWYQAYYSEKDSAAITLQQIESYVTDAKEQQLSWAQ